MYFIYRPFNATLVTLAPCDAGFRTQRLSRTSGGGDNAGCVTWFSTAGAFVPQVYNIQIYIESGSAEQLPKVSLFPVDF